jgi:hypothetical protein
LGGQKPYADQPERGAYRQRCSCTVKHLKDVPGKKPPAPSASRRPARAAAAAASEVVRMAPRDIETGIARQIYIALERLGADQELLGIVANWCETLNDAETLSMLRKYNTPGKAWHRMRY